MIHNFGFIVEFINSGVFIGFSQVKFIFHHTLKSTQAGNSEKTMRSSTVGQTAPFSNN